MAFYSLDPDGATSVTTDDGRTVRTAFTPDDLEARGILPAPPPPEMAMSPMTPQASEVEQRLAEFQANDPQPAAMGPLSVAGGVQRVPGGQPSMPDFAQAAVAGAPQTNPGPQPLQSAPLERGARFVGETEGRAIEGNQAKGKPIPLSAPGQQSTPRAPDQGQAIRDLVASRIVSRSGPRKAGEVPAGRTVTVAPTPSEEDIADVEVAENTALELQGQQVADSVAARDTMLTNQMLGEQVRLDKLEEARQRREATNSKLAELEKADRAQQAKIGEMRSVSATDDFWASRGTFARIIGAIAAGFSAGAATASGGPAYGLNVLQEAIKDNAEKLRQQHEMAVEQGRTAHNAYTEALQLYGTPEMAMREIEDRGELIADRMKAIMLAKLGNQEELQRHAVASAELTVAQKQRRAERNASAAGQVAKSFRYDPGSGGGASIDPRMVELWIKLGGDPKKVGEANEKAVRLPDGRYAFARQSGSAPKLQEAIKVDSRISDTIDRIQHLREQPGAKTDPAVRGQIEAAAAELFVALKSGASLGTLDKGSLEFRDEWLGDPTTLLDAGGPAARLKEVAAAARSRVQDTVRFELQSDPDSLNPVLGATPKGAKSDE